jgi:GNAT superfamily N-acetyltransferase
MIREYETEDFDACVELVNRVWDFDSKFEPQRLAQLFKMIYTAASLSESNFYIVIEEKQNVKGFLFGKAGSSDLYKTEYSGVLGDVKILYQLLFLKEVKIKKKLYYFKIALEHHSNRKKVNPKAVNEVNLFAVNPTSQGKGYGRQLMDTFIDYCRKLGVERITLETDKECNYGFYDHLGFSVKGEFYSPLQKEYSGVSGNTYLYELVL